MSGIGFQKLNGTGTSAYQQLQKTSELIAEMQKLNYPDIYKQARMFVGDNFELTPVHLTWSTNTEQTINFNARYFGYWTISLEQEGTGASNNSFGRGRLIVYDGNVVQFRSGRMVHGDDIVSLTNSVDPNIIGFGTSMRLEAGGSQSGVFGTLSFIGFEIGEAVADPVIIIPIKPVPIPQPPDVNVQIDIKSRPNGVQLFNATFGALAISQANGNVNYNQIATQIVLNGFQGLKFDFKYFKNDFLFLSGSNQLTKSIDLYHSNSHKIEIDYSAPINDYKLIAVAPYIEFNLTHFYDDSTYINHNGIYSEYPTNSTTLRISDPQISGRVTRFMILKAGVLTSFTHLDDTKTPAINLSLNDLVFVTHESGQQLSVANFSDKQIKIANGGDNLVNPSGRFLKITTADSVVTNMGLTTVSYVINIVNTPSYGTLASNASFTLAQSTNPNVTHSLIFY